MSFTNSCFKSKWVVIDEEYKKEKSKTEGPILWLVNSITTDGLQVKVTMATLETSAVYVAASGLDCLDAKGMIK